MEILKGKHAVIEALHAGAALERILILFQAQNHPDMRTVMQLAKQKKIKVQLSSKEAFERAGGDKLAQGVLAYVSETELYDLDTLLNQTPLPPFIVMLDHIQDPYNFGAILRTCETMGVSWVIYPKDRSCPITPGVVKASSGALHYLNLVKVTNLAQSLEKLEKAGYWIYGTSDKGAVDLQTFKPHAPMVLIVGNEEKGLSPILAKKTHGVLQIPMKGRISSMNVSVAAGILIYTLSRNLNVS